jgi:hypothetical protein
MRCIEAGAKQKKNGGRVEASGIEPDTAFEQGMQLHQRPQTVAERRIYIYKESRYTDIAI